MTTPYVWLMRTCIIMSFSSSLSERTHEVSPVLAVVAVAPRRRQPAPLDDTAAIAYLDCPSQRRRHRAPGATHVQRRAIGSLGHHGQGRVARIAARGLRGDRAGVLHRGGLAAG